jgi:hypothetical protein
MVGWLQWLTHSAWGWFLHLAMLESRGGFDIHSDEQLMNFRFDAGREDVSNSSSRKAPFAPESTTDARELMFQVERDETVSPSIPTSRTSSPTM